MGPDSFNSKDVYNCIIWFFERPPFTPPRNPVSSGVTPKNPPVMDGCCHRQGRREKGVVHGRDASLLVLDYFFILLLLFSSEERKKLA